jgi:PAS domain S-box-containing protein
MKLRNMPIRAKLTLIILLTSAVVMLLMRGAFFIYEYAAFRKATSRHISTLAEIVASNSTAALAFRSAADAAETLSALRTEPQVVAAALFDAQGRLFARYPDNLPLATLPQIPGPAGFSFDGSRLAGFQPVVQKGRLGTLYLECDTGPIMRAWLVDSVEIALAVMAVVVLVAYGLSRALQKQVSEPILDLAETARAISEQRDFSVRARRHGDDELGLLTNAFNQMLAQIHEQDLTLRRNERRFRALIEHSGDSISLIDANNRILYLSPAVHAVEGYTPEELIGHNGLENTHPDDLPRVQQYVNELVARPGQPVAVEWRRRHKAGHWIWLEGTATNLLTDPAVEAIVTNYRNVTDRKVAEAEIQRLNQDLERRVAERTAELQAANRELERRHAVFENVFEALPGLYLVLTPDLKIVAASNAYLRATLTEREKVVGRDLFDVFPDNPDHQAADGTTRLRASLQRVLDTAQADTMAIQRYDIRRPDGVFEERYWSPVNSPLLGVDRRIEYLIHRVEDVTDFVRRKSDVAATDALRARMEQMEAEIFKSYQRIEATNRQLEAANRELESFSYSVSHDLRAPLRHIDGYAQLLQKRVGASLDETDRRYLANITSSAKGLGTLIDELLAFSRMGRTEMRRSSVDIRGLVASVLQSLQPDCQGRQIDWRIGDLPPVTADPSMLRLVWSNLLGNAVKYTRGRSSAVVEITHRLDGADGHVFSVRDNGAGFDMKYADKLFGVFQRLHAAAEFEGTGIGLANVRRIVQRHGGRTWAEGAVDVGATFFFTLPFAHPPGPSRPSQP